MQHLPHIWLIDDDEAIIDLIQRAFQKEDLSCQVRTFTDVSSLLAGIRDSAQLPALLLVDYYMPGTDGLQLIDYLRHNPSTQSLKMVLFSQKITAQVALQAEQMGVYQVARKPFDFEHWREFARDICLAGHFP